jgi:hypothetical protein
VATVSGFAGGVNAVSNWTKRPRPTWRRRGVAATAGVKKKRGRPETASLKYWHRSGFFGGGLLGLDDRFFAFEVALATLFVFSFVVLFSHMSLYIVRWLRFCVCTMNFYALRFNLYLLLLVTAATVTGCKTDKADKPIASLRFYMENRAQVPGSGETISVLRANPVLVTVGHEPMLTEANVVAATLLETPGGYAIEVKFDETGTWILEQYTSANSGRHIAIFSQWSEETKDSRWLAAPIISHRIADGIFAFTPDASREEARQIVLGLNNEAKKIAKGK